ncbi:hypothetical protein LCGC14_2235450, partial [marine sediment metagenome]
DAFLLKYDSSGNLLWNKSWGGFDNDYGRGIALDDSGYVFIMGYTESYGAGGWDALLLKYDSSGNLLWNKTWGGSSIDNGGKIALDGLGNVFITGYTESYGAGQRDVLLLKFDSSGTLLWYKTWGGSGSDVGYGIALDDSENAFITGYTDSYGAGGWDAFLLKYDSSGNLVWNNTWGGSSSDFGVEIALNDSENAFITGYTDSYGEGNADAFLLKYVFDTDGDGLSDGDEVNTYLTDPNESDTDGDGLSDGDEVNTYGTDPNDSDTDGDDLTDGDEVRKGYDPKDPFSNPLTIPVIITIVLVIVILALIIFMSTYGRKKIIDWRSDIKFFLAR